MSDKKITKDVEDTSKKSSKEIKNTSVFDLLMDFAELKITIEKDGTNPHFNSKYTTLNEVLGKVLVPLAQCGLGLSQVMQSKEDGKQYMHTSIYNRKDPSDTIEMDMPLLLGKNDMQGLGSAITYARRYSITTLLNLGEEDDDGNNASKQSNTEALKNIQANKTTPPNVASPKAPATAPSTPANVNVLTSPIADLKAVFPNTFNIIVAITKEDASDVAGQKKILNLFVKTQKSSLYSADEKQRVGIETKNHMPKFDEIVMDIEFGADYSFIKNLYDIK